MAIYKYIKDLWKKPKENLGPLWKERLVEWRAQETTVRIAKPTRIDRARALGYKAIQGFVITRQRVSTKRRMRPQVSGGRRPKAFRKKKVLNMNYQQIAERRTNDKYVNCEVLNSYFVAKDGQNKWYEIIMVDKTHPRIIADKELNFLCTKTGRAYRGLTSAGRKSRGLRNKGKGAEKVRPSASAIYRKKAKKRNDY